MSELNETTETKTTTRKRAPRKAPAPKPEPTGYQSELVALIDQVNAEQIRDIADQNRRHYAVRAESWAKVGPSLSGSLMTNVSLALAQHDPAKLREHLLALAAVALAKVEEIDSK
ncbi:hypothetical protein SEA_MANEEKUL_40 [Streptomyces phage Maneekul]|uniref:Uncharacterized protein n=1 Tax=Streptomyces phage Yasdnil TaxID=2593360 RepID=A0A514U494_9CAUD|nr:hypothetical protein KGG98_gp40 [Streptomyces phage Yasdnil]AWN07408.1 hypothetical protein SEA_MANEEKUL_40 [Streptomyces phage Maneekul]QDK03210.1 hypothetical protein SEA_TUANPN_39 [Streptomyces phage TuanPN]QDK03764.1 hypothetical protein SEA_YASDNIL_40 [Streptomyces phage Yasdnil]USH46049.1 hypothetical protein SEA_EJEMPLO_39 [Streptomyces phage Ejemplo]